MSRRAVLGRSAAVLVVLSATPALADLIAAEVWANWQSALAAAGQSVTVGSEAASGGVLTLRDVELKGTDPTATSGGTIDQMVFTENSDGTVQIALSPSTYRVATEVSVAESDPAQTNFELYQSGLNMLASGTPDAVSYDYNVSTSSITVEEKGAGGSDAPVKFSMTFIGLDGTSAATTTADRQGFAGTSNAQRFSVKLEGADTANAKEFSFDTGISNVAIASSAVVPTLEGYANADAALKAGLALALKVVHSGGSSDFSFKGSSQSGQGSARMGPGELDFAFEEGGLRYAGSSNTVDVRMSSTSLPIPEMTLGMEQSAFRFEMPVVRSDEPEDFTFLASYRGVTLSESIWALFDPLAVLPREPANVVLDLSGKLRWLIDIMNPEAAADISAPPGELSELALNALELRLVGAELTGSGGFTFDNTDMTTFPGMPKPVGSVDLQLVGGNGLLDKLVELGFLPQNQSMGVRMMMGLFARPGEGEDTLVSTIEATEAGQILANGQPIGP